VYFEYKSFNYYILYYFTAPAILIPHPAITNIQQQQQQKNKATIYETVISQNENK